MGSLLRVEVPITAERAEEVRALLIGLFPQGFEEVDAAEGSVTFVAYTDRSGQERLRSLLGPGTVDAVEPGWEVAWTRFHRPVTVGPLWVGPPWEAPTGNAPVVIDPGQAFGTGAHPTTRLCLELLLGQPRGGIVDIGCGSGVLAIAAARLGFDPVVAIDIDPLAVEATAGNAAVNRAQLELRLCDACTGSLPELDLAVSNIALGEVRELAGRLRSRRWIASGYLASEDPALPGWRRVTRRTLGGWAADLFEPL